VLGVVVCASAGNVISAVAATMPVIEVDLSMIKCLLSLCHSNEQSFARFRSVRPQKNV
jgi:hypothetical protein